MSGFLTKLRVEWENEDDDDVPQWRLLTPLEFSSSVLGRTVSVPAGYVTDFASVPRAPILYFLAGNTGNRAAVVHDYLCSTKEVNRITADNVFYEALIASGVDEWRAKAMYLGVQSYTTSLLNPGWPPPSEGAWEHIAPQSESPQKEDE